MPDAGWEVDPSLGGGTFGQVRRGTWARATQQSGNIRFFRRAPDAGYGRPVRYYLYDVPPGEARQVFQGEVTEYQRRKYLSSLTDSQRELVRQLEYMERQRTTLMRRSFAEGYQARLATVGVRMSVGRILQDPVFNAAFRMLRIRQYEETSGQSLYDQMPYAEMFRYRIPTANQYTVRITEELMMYRKEQLLVFLGMRIPTPQGTVGDPYGNPIGEGSLLVEEPIPLKSPKHYTNTVMVPYYEAVGILRPPYQYVEERKGRS